MTVELCSFTNKFARVGRVCDSGTSPIRTLWAIVMIFMFIRLGTWGFLVCRRYIDLEGNVEMNFLL